jgi:hypothetical protein
MSVIGGKLFMPADLQVIRRYVVETPILKAVTEELRAVTLFDTHRLGAASDVYLKGHSGRDDK